MVKKEQCLPGVRLRVIKEENVGLRMGINEYSTAFGPSPLLFIGDVLEVLSKPRKVTNINLVRVRRVSDGYEGEVFWTHVRYGTEVL